MTTRTVRPTALLNPRPGARPRTTDINPHVQLDQQAPHDYQEMLHDAVCRLPGVRTGPSGISLPGTRAYFIADGNTAPGRARSGPADGFMLGYEFAHLHAPDDGSVHTVLPPWIVAQVAKLGWAELHPVAGLYGMPLNTVMLYGPRTEDEVPVLLELLDVARAYALNLLRPPPSAFVVDSAHVAP